MARYDYRCPSCNTVFEVEHGMLEHPEVKCPNCGSPAQRIFDASGIVLKGSGFYNTDERGSSHATAGTTALAKTGEKHLEKQGSKTLAKNADKPASTPKAAAPAKATAE